MQAVSGQTFHPQTNATAMEVPTLPRVPDSPASQTSSLHTTVLAEPGLRVLVQPPTPPNLVGVPSAAQHAAARLKFRGAVKAVIAQRKFTEAGIARSRKDARQAFNEQQRAALEEMQHIMELSGSSHSNIGGRDRRQVSEHEPLVIDSPHSAHGRASEFKAISTPRSTRDLTPAVATRAVSQPQFSRSAQLAYHIDRLLSRNGGIAFAIMLAGGIAALTAGGLIMWADNGPNAFDYSYGDATWVGWTYMADTGSQGQQQDVAARVVAFFVSVFGILFFAVVLGFVVDSIRGRMEALKQGRSAVLEHGHYVILGWTDKSFDLIQELCLAMQSEGGGRIVILAELEKEQVESELRAHFTPRTLLGTELIVRSGSALLISDLQKVSDSGDADKSDAKVLRTVLSIASLNQQLRGHVVVEMRDIDNQGLVEIVGRGMVETLVTHDIIGRLMVKCARQPGLAEVYEMFLGFEGDEFYLARWPELTGLTFGELFNRFPNAIPVGVKSGPELLLNPSLTYVMQDADELLVLAEDDDTYKPEHPMLVEDPGEYRYSETASRPPEDLLMCGWRRDIDDVIDLLDSLVSPGSNLHMLSDLPIADRTQRLLDGGLNVNGLRNLKLVHHVGNSANRRNLEELPLLSYDSVLILADESLEADSMHSDSHTLASLLLIRHIQDRLLQEAQLKSPTHQVPTLKRTKDYKSTRNLRIQPPGMVLPSVSAPASPDAFMSMSETKDLDSGGNSPTEAIGAGPSLDASRKHFFRDRASAPPQLSPPKASVVCCEILDSRTRAVVQGNQTVASLADFIRSNSVVSRVLAMVAERREVRDVLEELLGADGNEVLIRPATKYVSSGDTMMFWSLFLRVRRHHEILLGYRIAATGETVINPKQKTALITWAQDDELIVMGKPAHSPDRLRRTSDSIIIEDTTALLTQRPQRRSFIVHL